MLITSYKEEKRKETQLLGSVGRDTMKHGLLQPEKNKKQNHVNAMYLHTCI